MTTLFWDKNLGKAIPKALQMLKPPSVTIRYYLQVYPNTKNTTEGGDDAWLKDVGERGWFVISQDYNLHVRENELFALKQYDVGCFYLWGANSPKWDTFRCFSRAYDRIIEAARDTPRPFVYRVKRNGTLERVSLP